MSLSHKTDRFYLFIFLPRPQTHPCCLLRLHPRKYEAPPQEGWGKSQRADGEATDTWCMKTKGPGYMWLRREEEKNWNNHRCRGKTWASNPLTWWRQFRPVMNGSRPLNKWEQEIWRRVTWAAASTFAVESWELIMFSTDGCHVMCDHVIKESPFVL